MSSRGLCSLRLELTDIDASVLAALRRRANTAQLTSLTLDANRFGPAATSALAACLRNLPALQHLSLSAAYLHADGAVDVAVAIGGLSELRSLSLRSTRLGRAAAKALASINAELQYLTALDLGSAPGLRVGDECYLMHGFCAATNLETLRLAGTKLSDEGAVLLAMMLQRLSSLRQLDVSGCGMHTFAAQTVALGLAGKPALQALQLDGNSFVGDASAALASSLAEGSQLTALALSHSELTVADIRTLQPVLQHNAGLKSLTLCGGGDFPEVTNGENELAAVFAEGGLAHLTALQLKFQRGARAFDALMPLASGLSLLKTLRLDSCTIPDGGAGAALAAFLPELSQLEDLAISGFQKSQTDACLPLVAAIAQLSRLTSLDTGSVATEAFRAALVPAISTLPALQHFTAEFFATAVVASAMGKALPAMQALRVLSLNAPSPACLLAGVSALAALTALTRLSVYCGSRELGGGSLDLTPLAQGLKSMQQLRSFHISTTAPLSATGASGTAALMGALHGVQHVTSLYIHLLDGLPARELASGLAFLSRLCALDVNVTCRDADDCDMAALTAVLRGLTRLTKLQLWTYGYGADDGAIMAAWVRPMRRLERFSLATEGIGVHCSEFWNALFMLECLQTCDVLVLDRLDFCPFEEASDATATMMEVQQAMEARGGTFRACMEYGGV